MMWVVSFFSCSDADFLSLLHLFLLLLFSQGSNCSVISNYKGEISFCIFYFSNLFWVWIHLWLWFYIDNLEYSHNFCKEIYFRCIWKRLTISVFCLLYEGHHRDWFFPKYVWRDYPLEDTFLIFSTRNEQIPAHVSFAVFHSPFMCIPAYHAYWAIFVFLNMLCLFILFLCAGCFPCPSPLIWSEISSHKVFSSVFKLS